MADFQSELKNYQRAPRYLVREGRVLEVDIFIAMPNNATIIHFRRKGDKLSAQDTLALSKVPADNLLILKADADKLITLSPHALAQEMQEKGLESPAVKQAAVSLLKSIDTSEPGPGKEVSGDVARKTLEKVPKFVQDLMLHMKATPAKKAYEEALASSRDTQDALATHNHQVSAIAVLMMLSLGNAPMDDLPDVGAAGLVHDLALKQLPVALLEKHLIGEEDLSPGEKIIYMRHTDMILDVIKKNQIPMTPGATRAVQLHHENWDGSGFRGMIATSIYRPARVLRIADDVVACINNSAHKMGISDALGHLAKRKGRGDAPLYDPEILLALVKALG